MSSATGVFDVGCVDQMVKLGERECSLAHSGNVLELASFSPPRGALASVIKAARAGLLALAPFVSLGETAAQEGPVLIPPVSALRPIGSPFQTGDLQSIRRCDGSTMAGVVEAIDPRSVHVKNMGSGDMQIIPASTVLQVVSHRKTITPEVHLEERALLRDGGYVNGQSFTLSHMGLSLTINEQRVNFSRESVHALQFFNDPSYQTDWRSLVSRSNNRNDIIAIKKGVGVLDHLEGMVTGISAERVMFHFDGKDLNVPRAKLYGVVFAPSRIDSTVQPLCYVKGADFTIACKHVSLAQEILTAEAVAGPILKFSSRLVTIDYSPSRTDSLRQLLPQVVKWNPFASVEEDRLFEIMIDGNNEPIRYGAPLGDGSLSYDVVLNGELTFSVPLRRRYSLISATVEPGQPLDTMTIMGENRYLTAKTGKRIVNNVEMRDLCWDVTDMKTASISVGAGSMLRLNDLRFVKQSQD